MLQELAGETGPQLFNEYLDEWCDQYRRRIEEIADEKGVPLTIQDHQLIDENGVPSTRTRRQIRHEADIITTVDPSPQLASFVIGTVTQNPQARSVFAYSTRDGLEDAFEVIGTAKTPILITHEVRRGMIILLEREVSLRMLPKAFAFLYRDEGQMDAALSQAFLYPDCKDIEGRWQSCQG